MSSTATKSLLALCTVAAALSATHFTSPQEADACGCFVPPDPTVPIVQAGERILFARENGIITSHVQVQYAGPAEEFGWLLPLPSIPEMELGTDETFAQLIAQTQPTYRLDRQYNGDCPFDPFRNGGFGGGAGSPDSASEGDDGGGDGTPLVLRDAIGPYDFAVLKADDKQDMLDWLDENGFFVPAGTDNAVDPYIRPGAYFLALKLLSGEDTGDLQPVVINYESDLPMIPIILTSVAADPDMGVQVWVLGEDRAIPRNYNHTKINDAALDWLNAGANYVDVVTDAVDEIEGHHSFITEYAGTSGVMVDILDYQGRFGNLGELATKDTVVDYVQYMNDTGFALFTNSQFGFSPQYSSQVLNVLQKHFPMPQALIDEEIAPADYYWNIYYYLVYDREENPEKYADLDEDFDPTLVTDELRERFVEPTLKAGELFRNNPYLSRMFTTLSPNEMTKDPVFSFSPDLPEVSNVHTGTLTYYCNLVADPRLDNTPAILETEQGFELVFSDGTGESSIGALDANNFYTEIDMPQSHFQEVLYEEGEAEVVIDNTKAIAKALADARDGGSGGCSVGGKNNGAGALFLLLALVALRRKRD